MTDTPNAPFAYDGLDRVIHEKARLGILTSLYTHRKGLAFKELRALCGLTDGNLSRHIKALSDAKLINVEKSFQDNRPHTFIKLTAHGAKRFQAYIDTLEQVIRDAAQPPEKAGSGSTSKTRLQSI